MATKLIALIHDDWEIRGNGLGNVAHLQYIPALALMRIAKDAGIPLTFMVELGQQLAFLRFADRDRNLAIQSRLWEECVGLMSDKGFDVQPHIHPHWFRSRYEDGFIHVDRNWNLATYEDNERRSILRESFAYLTGQMRKINNDYVINTFKAGSDALQPSKGILTDLENEGVRLVLGPRSGMKAVNSEFVLDYRSLEEGTLPYYPDFNDINLVGPENGVIVLPMTYWDMDLAGKTRAVWRNIAERFHGKNATNRFPYHGVVPESIRSLNPRVDLSESAFVRKFFRPFRTGLNIAGPQSLAELSHTLDAMVYRLLRVKAETLPLVIESHSKDHEGNWDTIARFFEYMTTRYGAQMEFMTVTQFNAYLTAHPSMVRAASPSGT
jgi:hypothetical protein